MNDKIKSIVVISPHGNTYQISAPANDALVIDGHLDVPQSHVLVMSDRRTIAVVPHDWTMILHYEGQQQIIRSVML